MDREETIKLLMLVKGNWYRQPIDERITDVWLGILSAIPIQEAWAATMEIICSGAEELPTPGKIYHAVMQERLSRPRHEYPAIEGPRMTQVEVTEALARLRQIQADLAANLSLPNKVTAINAARSRREEAAREKIQQQVADLKKGEGE